MVCRRTKQITQNEEGKNLSILYSPLFLWLLDTDKGNLDVLPAFRAGNTKSNWLLHYPFGNGGNNRVDIIETLV